MDGNSLDLSGKKEEKQPLASYKAIPEADMEEEAISSAKVDRKVKNYIDKDGAHEKMLPDEESQFNSNNVDIPEHNVIIKEKNGDAKLDIETNKRRRLKKKVVPRQKIGVSKFPLRRTHKARSQSQRLMKCSCDQVRRAETEKSEEVEESLDVTMTDKLSEPSTSGTIPADCESHKSSFEAHLENKFTGDKYCQTEFSNPSLSQILDSNKKMLNFTGVDLKTLSVIQKCVENVASYNNLEWPNMKERLILVLCKLKLNMSFDCLAPLFNMASSACRDIFYSTLNLLSVTLRSVIYWPSKEEICRNMPKCFENYTNTRVVLDGIEIEIQKVNCLKCRINSYSYYKGANTIKYLIGIAPAGIITFISKGYGGRASYEAIFENENLIEKLEVNDAIMTDKDISIEKECDERSIRLIRPPFLKKQEQLSKARVHLKRVIQMFKKFKIIHGQMSLDIVPYLDEILTVLGAIVNLSPPVLSDDEFLK